MLPLDTQAAQGNRLRRVYQRTARPRNGMAKSMSFCREVGDGASQAKPYVDEHPGRRAGEDNSAQNSGEPALAFTPRSSRLKRTISTRALVWSSRPPHCDADAGAQAHEWLMIEVSRKVGGIGAPGDRRHSHAF